MSHSTLTGLTLYNFRNFAHKSLSFASPLILITGQNGAGKTSVLEATGYSFLAHSFLGARPEQLIKAGEEQAFVSMCLAGESGERTITNVGWSRGGEKNIKIDNKVERTHKELAKILCPVAITQDDLGLINGSPETRRTFINQLQILLDGNCQAAWSGYKRAMVQRNALINANATTGSSTDVFAQWTKLMWQFGQQIQKWRIELLGKLEPIFAQKIRFLELKKTVRLVYSPKVCLLSRDSESILADARLMAKEFALGHSAFGPHLDDFQIIANDLDAKHFASRGETKLLLIALKAAALELAKSGGYDKNLLLIDDLITDLDEHNLNKGLALILSAGCQTIITSPTQGILSLTKNNFQHVEL